MTVTWNFKFVVDVLLLLCGVVHFNPFTVHQNTPTMKISVVALLALLASSSSSSLAFVVPHFSGRATSSSLYSSSSSTDQDVLATLPPELLKLTKAFCSVGDDKLRYKQLLYMANQLPPLENPEKVMIPKNKVPGCLSTVHVDGTATFDEEKQEYVVDFVGESDGLLTKGLVALLVRYVVIM
jgi:sulfur transfer protein SufE